MSNEQREQQIKEAARQRANQYDHPSKWSDTYYGFIEGAKWADAYPAWVSVEERLPPRAEHSFIFSDYVLVCDNNGYMDTACYNFEKNRWDWLNNVTHWMPLPQLPVKKGGQDETD